MGPSIPEPPRTRALTPGQQWAWWADEDPLRGLGGRPLQQIGRPRGRGARVAAGALGAWPRGPGRDPAVRLGARAERGGLRTCRPVALAVRRRASGDPR